MNSEKTDIHASALDDLREALVDDLPEATVSVLDNRWGGLDLVDDKGQTVRLEPTDSEWYGVDFHALNANGVCMRSASYRGPFDTRRIAAMVEVVRPYYAAD